MSTLWNPLPSPIFTSSGSFARGALAFFYTDNSTTPLVVYQDSSLTVPHAWPVVADMVGVFPAVYLPHVTYRRRITTSDGTLITDAGDIDNPAPPSAGGGIVVTSDQVLQTGDPIWRLRVGQVFGFVRMNGRTLGNASSGATEYAAANASALFTFLWSNLPDSIATVSTGRGASAAADYAANKTIVIPTMQGYLAAGLDDLGTTSLGKIQAITTCNTNGATGVVVVTSAAGIAVGQNAIINGVAVGTVTAISGTNVTVSVVPAGPAVGVSFRSSFFSDATQVGAAAGDPNATPTTDQIPSHNHGITDPGHSHNLTSAINGGAVLMLVARNNVADATALTTASSTTGITVNNTGGGNPFGILQPTRLGSWYMKL